MVSSLSQPQDAFSYKRATKDIHKKQRCVAWLTTPTIFLETEGLSSVCFALHTRNVAAPEFALPTVVSPPICLRGGLVNIATMQRCAYVCAVSARNPVESNLFKYCTLSCVTWPHVPRLGWFLSFIQDNSFLFVITRHVPRYLLVGA